MPAIKNTWIWKNLPNWMKVLLVMLLIAAFAIVWFRYSSGPVRQSLGNKALCVAVLANLNVMPSMFALITFGTSSIYGRLLLILSAIVALYCELNMAIVGDDFYFLFTERLASLLAGTLLGIEFAMYVALKMKQRLSENFPVHTELSLSHYCIYGVALFTGAALIYTLNSHLHIIIDMLAGGGVGLIYEVFKVRNERQ